MSLPIFQDENKNIMLLQTNWASALNKLLDNPLLNGIILKDQVLSIGSNTISHRLQRAPQGCIIISKNAAASIFEEPSPITNLFLVLNSSAACVIDLYIF